MMHIEDGSNALENLDIACYIHNGIVVLDYANPDTPKWYSGFNSISNDAFRSIRYALIFPSMFAAYLIKNGREDKTCSLQSALRHYARHPKETQIYGIALREPQLLVDFQREEYLSE